MRRRVLSLIPLALISISSAYGATLTQIFQQAGQTLTQIIVYFFGLKFLGVSDPANISAFIRLNLWVMVFIVAFYLAMKMKLDKRQATVLALCIAFLATFTITPETVLTIGGIFGFMTALILMIPPILLIAFSIFGFEANTRTKIVFKIVMIAVSIWILVLAQPLFTGHIAVGT